MAELATRQHGVVALRQLLSLGIGMRAVEKRLRDGRLHRLHRDVYAVGHTRLSQRGFWWAAVLAYGDDSLLSHRSAAALWGLARQQTRAIDVTAPMGRQGISRRERIWIHRGRLHPEDRAERGGIPVTTAARTLFDYAEVVDFQRLEHAWEEADRLRLLRLHAVEEVCERGYGRRALQPIRRLLGEARAPDEKRSPLENRFAAFCRMHRLPPPATNVLVLDHEADAFWPAARLVIEMDSWEFHGHRAAFERDRARDAALQAANYRVLRLTHRRLENDAPTSPPDPDQLPSVPASPLKGSR